MSSNDAITEPGTLVFGVKVGDVRHRDFVLRAPTVQDSIDASNEVGASNPVLINAAVFALQLVSLGTLTRRPRKPPELKPGEVVPTYIDTALICAMHPLDFNQLEEAAVRLQKKLLSAAEDSPAGGPACAPSSPATESPSSTS